MAKLRIGFIGAGSMGQCAHLKNYAALPDCEVVALAEVRPELGRAVATRYGIPRVYRDHRELLAAEQLDGIVAAQPFTRHGALAPELLQAGTPLFMEKPLAGSVAVGEKILTAVRDSGAWLMLGYHKRSDPAMQFARAEIERLKETGELGRMRYVRLLMPEGDWVAGGFNDLIRSEEPLPPLAADPPAADLSPERYQEYLAFVNYYIHQVNLMRYLLGEPYHLAYAAPSGVLLAVESASGVTGTIEMSPFRTTTGWQESAFVAFERGWIQADLPAPLAANRPGTVRLFRDPGGGAAPQTITPALPPVHAMRQQAMNFLSAIRGERKPPCDAAEALEDLRIARDYIRLRYGE